MYGRFTDRARKVLQLAKQEAQRFEPGYVGTEHILLGLVREGASVASLVLKNLDIDLRKIRLEVEKVVQPEPGIVLTGKLPQTPRAKKVIEYSIEEAHNLNHNYVGTEHLLLGLLREEEGMAAQVLMNLGLRLEVVRQEILHLLGLSGLVLEVRDVPSLVPLSLEKMPELPDLPAAVRQARAELIVQVEQLNQEKESAVAEQAFERAAYLRDQADKLKKKKEQLLLQWPGSYEIDPSWLSWNGGTILQMARLLAEERRWEELPLLADALEEAGCTNAEILGHCRQPGEHFRRCWVLQLLLGRP
jgi:ATP-dependent Clp protease ATP-binding subunit ClpA